MTIYEYVASNKPKQSLSLLAKHGFNISQQFQMANPREKINRISIAMRNLAKEKGDSVFYEIAEMHPDKELILSANGEKEGNTGMVSKLGKIKTEHIIIGIGAALLIVALIKKS